MVEYDIPKDFIIKITDLSGGENRKVTPLKIKDNQFVKIKNWLMTEIGDLEMRGGCTAVTSASGSDPAKALAPWITNTLATKVMVASGGSVYYKSGTGLTELITGLTAASEVKMLSMFNRFYVASDGDAVKVADDVSTVRTAGCTAPTVKPTVALNGAGTLTGNYYYAYTYVYPWGESSKSPTSDLIAPSSQNVLVTIPGSYPAGCTSIKIYRTAAGSTILKELYTLTSPTLSYDDGLSDGVLGEEIPTDNDAPPASNWVHLYKNYAYYLDGTDAIWFSDLGYPEVVKSSSYLSSIQDSDNRPICVHNTLNPDVLLVFYEGAIVAYTGTSPFLTDPDPLSRVDINFDMGLAAPHSVVRAGEDVLFLGSDRRIYSVDRVSLANSETVQTISLSENIQDLMLEELNPDMIPKAQAMYWDRKYILCVATGTNTYLDTAVIVDFNLKTMPWVEATPIQLRSCGVFEDDSGEEQPYLGANASPNVYQFFEGTTDGGTVISPELESKHFGGELPFNRKDWVELRIYGEATPSFTFTIKIHIEKDGEEKTASITLSGTEEESAETQYVWNEGVWNETGLWNSNVSYSTAINNFIKSIYIPALTNGGTLIGSDGQFFWWEMLDVASAYQLIIKGFEIRGTLYKAN